MVEYYFVLLSRETCEEQYCLKNDITALPNFSIEVESI